MKYTTRRPSRQAIEDMMFWFARQGIHMYTGNADLTTGQRHFGCMDIQTADEAVQIHKLNTEGTWIDPTYEG